MNCLLLKTSCKLFEPLLLQANTILICCRDFSPTQSFADELHHFFKLKEREEMKKKVLEEIAALKRLEVEQAAEIARAEEERKRREVLESEERERRKREEEERERERQRLAEEMAEQR